MEMNSDMKLELAIEVINLKIAKEIKENKELNYEKFKDKIIDLENKKKEAYKGNQEVIQEILDKYLQEVKGEK